MLIGYARISTDAQKLNLQQDALRAAGCERIFEDYFKGKKPVALFVDEAHDLHSSTLTGLKRLIEVISDGDGSFSVILAGHPKLKNDLRRPTMEEIGYRATIFGCVAKKDGGDKLRDLQSGAS
jgi:type II secretory pathway predicted ATPase ExeA